MKQYQVEFALMVFVEADSKQEAMRLAAGVVEDLKVPDGAELDPDVLHCAVIEEEGSG